MSLSNNDLSFHAQICGWGSIQEGNTRGTKSCLLDNLVTPVGTLRVVAHLTTPIYRVTCHVPLSISRAP